MEFYVFDTNFNRLGIVDGYSEAEFSLKYHDHSNILLVADASEENKALLMNNDAERIITKLTDTKRGYLIEVAEYEDEQQLKIIINAKSLSVFTNMRLILGQQRFSGNIENVIKNFVFTNAIQPADPNRIIPHLILGENKGINIEIDESYTNVPLDIAIWEMCIKYDISFEILMNHEMKKYEFITYQGTDRSTLQTENAHVIFAKEFDNVNLQSYIDDKSNYKSTAYVAGEGEGVNRVIVRINDNLSGLNRREVFFDARDLQSTYKDENDVEITIPQSQYNSLLEMRGNSKLVDYQRIRSFSSDIDLFSQFIFNEHYFLGDKVSNRNDELGVVTHSRVVTARETYYRQGYALKLEFGTSIPSFFEKLKKGANK